MSFAAEPYGVFVDGLLTALTGGVSRESFTFDPAQTAYDLTPPGPIRPSAVRVHGLVGNAFYHFRRTVDFDVDGAGRLTFLSGPATVTPDDGTRVYVNYDHQGPSGAAPVLSDRNPGSVTRLLAESFAREYAVLSGQLEAVYKGAYLDTASGLDLDNIAALMGLARRDPTFATGSIVFSRTTPAPADIAIPAGTQVSTIDVPAATFETTEDAHLRRGALSTEVRISAITPGSGGIVRAGVIAVINRPILGVTGAQNPQATRFAGGKESDDALRDRIGRALQYAGRATTGAVKGALTQIDGLREKDILVTEDPIQRPGVVKLDVALPDLGDRDRDATIRRALDLIEDTRPIGVRIAPNIDAPTAAGAANAGVNPAPETPDAPPVLNGAVDSDLFLPVDVTCVITPTTLGLTDPEREDIRAAAEAVITNFIAEAGIGETLIYNRLVSQLMALDGVLDVGMDLRAAAEDTALPGRKNILPAVASARPTAGVITVTLGGALVTLDATVTLSLKGAGLLGDAEAARAAALGIVEGELRAALAAYALGSLSKAALTGLVTVNAETYTISDLSYLVTYEDDGIRINQRDVTLPLSGLERLWLRSVHLAAKATP